MISVLQRLVLWHQTPIHGTMVEPWVGGDEYMYLLGSHRCSTTVALFYTWYNQVHTVSYQLQKMTVHAKPVGACTNSGSLGVCHRSTTQSEVCLQPRVSVVASSCPCTCVQRARVQERQQRCKKPSRFVVQTLVCVRHVLLPRVCVH